MQWQELRSHIRHLPAREVSRVERAFVLGKKMHEGQKRRSGEPYFNHPVAVAHMLSDLGADSETLIAALLHDTVEDTPLTLSDIDHEFDGKVTMLIDGVTKLDTDDVGLSPKLDQQIETLRKIFTLMEEDVRIMVIKLVDRLHNMQTVEFLPTEKQQLLAKETLEVFVKIADKLCMQDLRDELESLCLAVLEPETFSRLLEIRTQNEARSGEVLEQMQTTLRHHDKVLAAKNPMHFEYKTWGQLRTQLAVGSSVATGLTTMTAAFVCDDVDACYRVLGALHQLWKREMLSFEDFINAPQLNGYQGLHTTIIAQDGTRVRCKIRTRTMQEYARKGIATLCFKGTSNITDILPWTKHLSPVTKDTAGSSNDFWETLKSDILGDTIIIHGPDDRTVQVPHGATALDAVCYLFKETAMRMEHIRVNGLDVAPHTLLHNADTLDVTFVLSPSVDRLWIEWVHTSLAAAAIHTALSHLPTKTKIHTGRQALENLFHEKGKGRLEEFDERQLSDLLEQQGIGTLSDALISIGEAKRKPADVFNAIFLSDQEKLPSGKKRRQTIQFSLKNENIDGAREIAGIMQKHTIEWRSVRMSEIAGTQEVRYSMTLPATDAEMQLLARDIDEAGGKDIEQFVRTQRENILITIVVTLWALNPVMAKWFLLHGVAPITLITIRFLTVCAFMTAFFAVWRKMTRTKFIPIPSLTRLAFKPTLANAGMMVYVFALKIIPASVHLMILRFNTLLLPSLSTKDRSLSSLLQFLFLLLATLAGFLFALGGHTFLALILSVTTLVCYTCYSLWTEETLQKHNIEIRYPYFMLHAGLVSGIFGVLLLPWQHLSDLATVYTLPMVVYITFCVCVTQVCYSALLKTTRFKHFTDFFLVEVPLCVLFESLILGTHFPMSVYSVLGLAIGCILLLRWHRIA